MKDVVKFLEKNGFKRKKSIPIYSIYSNSECDIVIHDDHYSITNDEGDVVYSKGLNIYWLIGILTYHGYMDKNYKQ